MRAEMRFKQHGMSLVEIVISVAVAAVLMAGMSAAISGALDAEREIRLQNEAHQQARFALARMVNAVAKTRRLMIPLAENPVTAWKESEREVLAVTLDPTLDRNKDGWADANNDKDFLDVNNNGSRDTGEPERIDEDVDIDNTRDGKSGIIGIDDDNDGLVDESGQQDNDEDGQNFEDSENGIDDDQDGSVDEDLKGDMNADKFPGTAGVDDDFDGAVDEGEKEDNDEDGQTGEDWLDPVVFYLNGSTLMERMPKVNSASGAVFGAYPIANHVTQFQVKRTVGGNGTTVLVDLTLTLSAPDTGPVTLSTTVAVGGGL